MALFDISGSVCQYTRASILLDRLAAPDVELSGKLSPQRHFAGVKQISCMSRSQRSFHSENWLGKQHGK